MRMVAKLFFIALVAALLLPASAKAVAGVCYCPQRIGNKCDVEQAGGCPADCVQDLNDQCQAQSSNPRCLCYDDLEKITADNYKDSSVVDKIETSACEEKVVNDCAEQIKKQDGTRYSKCQFFPNNTACEDERNLWLKKKQARLESGEKTERGMGATVSRVIPNCLFEDKLSAECRDVSIFVVLLINITRYLFGIIGSLALAYFIYGGFTLILSEGNDEKVTKGKDIMVAAVIGLIVAFGAYVLVQFLGEVIGATNTLK
ncbi:MAG TPA: pilin [Patescibacteria group bacterium]|nr:pilin [Patescibacteria group bacterium]